MRNLLSQYNDINLECGCHTFFCTHPPQVKPGINRAQVNSSPSHTSSQFVSLSLCQFLGYYLLMQEQESIKLNQTTRIHKCFPTEDIKSQNAVSSG